MPEFPTDECGHKRPATPKQVRFMRDLRARYELGSIADWTCCVKHARQWLELHADNHPRTGTDPVPISDLLWVVYGR